MMISIMIGVIVFLCICICILLRIMWNRRKRDTEEKQESNIAKIISTSTGTTDKETGQVSEPDYPNSSPSNDIMDIHHDHMVIPGLKEHISNKSNRSNLNIPNPAEGRNREFTAFTDNNPTAEGPSMSVYADTSCQDGTVKSDTESSISSDSNGSMYRYQIQRYVTNTSTVTAHTQTGTGYDNSSYATINDNSSLNSDENHRQQLQMSHIRHDRKNLNMYPIYDEKEEDEICGQDIPQNNYNYMMNHNQTNHIGSV